ncbi:MAG TPA: DUF3014 domain-containing protein [Vicinamibacterales bacterium]|jgi:hypothetical protein|nr:DUF3014 domain-containing protein [Vicinamibacterales bacterium]
MAEFDDLRLNEPEHRGPLGTPPPRRSPGLVPLAIIAALIGVGLAAFFWARRPAPPAAAPAAKTTAQPEPVPPPRNGPRAVAGDNIPLPPLDESDTLVRQLVSQLSSHPRVAAWLATNGLLRNFALVVTNVSSGSTPIKALQSQRPSAPFKVRETPNGTVIDPASYRRYDGYADAVAGLDARNTAKLYETLKPRIAEAYRDLGYPDADIDAALTRAIIVLLRAPRLEGDVPVVQSSVMWKFADPKIEALPQAERQLIRMGPRNQRIIQDKLREIAPYLGIDPAQLPTEDAGGNATSR